MQETYCQLWTLSIRQGFVTFVYAHNISTRALFSGDHEFANEAQVRVKEMLRLLPHFTLVLMKKRGCAVYSLMIISLPHMYNICCERVFGGMLSET